MMIGKEVKSAMNISRRDILCSTVQTQREINTMMKKVLTGTRVIQVKNQPEKVKSRINPLNFYKTRKMKQVTMITMHLRKLGSTILESDMN